MDPLPLLARTLAHSTTSILLPYTMLFRSNDKQKQITFNGSDEEPNFYNHKKQIIIIRNVPERGPYGEYQRKKLMMVSVDDLSERTITEKKPYKDGNDNSNEIFRIGNATI